MITINLSGITFLGDEAKKLCLTNAIKSGDEIRIHCTNQLDEPNLWDADLSVIAKSQEGLFIHIGWIPKVGTIMKYMNKAYKDKDSKRYSNQQQRFDTAELLRGNIHTDLFRNNITPIGKIEKILFMDKDSNFYEESDPNLQLKLSSIICTFIYPNP